MMDFEDQLRNALARKQPSSGFAQRLAARSTRLGTRRNIWKPWVAGCLAASLLAGAFGIKQLEQRRDREKGRVARAQLLQALQITGHELQLIQRKIGSLD